jgi:hypothetical protein
MMRSPGARWLLTGGYTSSSLNTISIEYYMHKRSRKGLIHVDPLTCRRCCSACRTCTACVTATWPVSVMTFTRSYQQATPRMCLCVPSIAFFLRLWCSQIGTCSTACTLGEESCMLALQCRQHSNLQLQLLLEGLKQCSLSIVVSWRFSIIHPSIHPS